MTAPFVPANLDDLIRRYESGESMKQLADNIGVARIAMTRVLKKAGVKIRGRSDAEKLKWKDIKSDPAMVRRQMAKAWKARRGAVDPDTRKQQRAATRYAKQLHISPVETRLACELFSRGLAIEQQLPIHFYNLDIALAKDLIAVEPESFGPREKAPGKYAERLKYLLDEGWLVILVIGHYAWKHDYATVANQIVAVVKQARRNKTFAGHYMMIRSDGQGDSGSRANLDHLPRILCSETAAKRS